MSIRGTYLDGQIVLNQPTDWPNGMRVDILPLGETEPDDIVGISEEEQSNDAASISQWIQEFNAIPALSWSPEAIARLEEWQSKMKAFNLEAVRQQFEAGGH